ncbi:MAG: ferrous iron transport protein B, partial [Planctomycetota bacterium]
MEVLTVALTGNPNTGKTTVFNMLTGARQQVGNYPGVTVEITEGRTEHNDAVTTISDLPGTYSLSAHSEDERAARNFLLEVPTDVVIDVVDVTQLERNLYLALQLIEFGKPLVIALNMSDVAEGQGLRIDHQALSDHLGVPCIPTSGRDRRGRNELLDAAVAQARAHREMVRRHGHPVEQNRVPYARELEDVLRELQEYLIGKELIGKDRPARWYALKLLENDTAVIERYDLQEAEAVAASCRERLRATYGQDPVAAIADRRHEVIAEICKHCLASPEQPRRDLTGKLDAVLTHRWLGPMIFLGLMYAVFTLVFTIGAPPMDWLEQLFGWLSGVVDGLWSGEEETLLRSLLVDGIIKGVGGVLVFTPNILLLFLAIAALEASGYMARAAFLMDRYMHKLGLHGKRFIPMLIGFGCT